MGRGGEARNREVAKSPNREDAGLVMLPVGMIGCDGATLTVRVFSRVPMEKVREVHADTDSHTSVVLCRVVLEKLLGCGRGWWSLIRGSGWRGKRNGQNDQMAKSPTEDGKGAMWGRGGVG
jgi:hypothetical protein